jgi:LmbE family N-acetylglucosaminyl deacetylase
MIEEPTWGRLEPGVLRSLVVVSPHFDDAALGASHLLMQHPGSTVITVFGGRPARYPDPPGPWDAAGGFRTGDDVVAVRREEDRRAMEVLEARPVWLEFADHQYLEPGDRAPAEAIAPDLASAITAAGATAVFLPMGLANPDHGTAHDAGLLAREELAGPTWFCYEDAGYSQLPGLLAWRVAKLFRSGLWPTPALVPQMPDAGRKERAIRCYASQIPPLEAEHELSGRLASNTGEQYWRLAPPPPGWEGLVDVP